MKKINMLLIFSVAFTFVLSGCKDNSDSTSDAIAELAARNSGITQITFNTSHGTSVAKFDNAKKKIVSSDSTDNETGLVTSRSYDYDSDNNIRMLNVKKLYSPDTTYYYGLKEENVSRSSISAVITDIPKKVRTVSKSTDATSRSAATEETTTTEYYCDEKGDIVSVIQKDAYGNIKMKSAEADEGDAE